MNTEFNKFEIESVDLSELKGGKLDIVDIVVELEHCGCGLFNGHCTTNTPPYSTPKLNINYRK